ncbi:TPA: hypothetical protein ACQVHY_003318 [Serratia marcescens]
MKINCFTISMFFAVVLPATTFPAKATIKAEFYKGERVQLSGSVSAGFIDYNNNTAMVPERGYVIVMVNGGYNRYSARVKISQNGCSDREIAAREINNILFNTISAPRTVSHPVARPKVEIWCPNFNDGGHKNAFFIYSQDIPREPDPVPVNVCRVEQISDVIDFGMLSSGKVNGEKRTLSGWLNCDNPATIRVRFYFSDGNDWMSMGTDLLAYLYVGNIPGQVGEVYNVGQYHSINISVKLGSLGNSVPGKYSNSAVLEYNIL